MAKTATARVEPFDATPSIGALIDDLHATREKIRGLNKEVEALNSQKANLETRLIEALDAQGVTQSRGASATASISETIIPQVKDWDRFYAFIARNKAYYMLERRPAAAAYREALELRKNRPIPGVESFTKRTISLRSR